MASRGAGRAATAVLLAAGLAPLLCSGSARADATYEATADATGIKLIFSNQSIPLGVSPQAQGPTAAVKQTSLHQSDGYAAFPDPGQDVAGLAADPVGLAHPLDGDDGVGAGGGERPEVEDGVVSQGDCPRARPRWIRRGGPGGCTAAVPPEPIRWAW